MSAAAIVAVVDLETGDRAVCERDQVAETIRPWFPGAPADVHDQIAALQAALNHRDYTGEHEAFLRIRIEPADAGDEDEPMLAIYAHTSGPQRAALHAQLDTDEEGDDDT
ncbi:hypothetical protein [Mycobacterium canetti]|uniref:hypothetical protein n=1 Tax=Mycobacterium canetti TaxID=78331 RepID=UPI0002A5834A|nr:hypothetical protein [Mycobacterium canetti]CCK59360.1 Conserved PhiRv1-like prophage protein of unknown function [Mycobacterium canettii CIPT 140070010]